MGEMMGYYFNLLSIQATVLGTVYNCFYLSIINSDRIISLFI